MKKLIGNFPIKNLQENKYEDSLLYSPIDEKNVQDFENEWRPRFVERRRNLKAHETDHSANIQDSHWQWREKSQKYNKRMDYESFAVECAGRTQGLMVVRTIAFAKELSQLNQFLIYIDLLAVAPWNRRNFVETRLYGGVGPLLVATAISYSVDQGLDGRIGLHSLPQSETWYRDRCCMTDLGPDADHPQNLRYFEMTVDQAKTYISI